MKVAISPILLSCSSNCKNVTATRKDLLWSIPTLAYLGMAFYEICDRLCGHIVCHNFLGTWCRNKEHCHELKFEAYLSNLEIFDSKYFVKLQNN